MPQAALTEGSYVRVFGHLRAFQGKKMVVAINIRPVADPNEITFHLLEVGKAPPQHLSEAPLPVTFPLPGQWRVRAFR